MARTSLPTYAARPRGPIGAGIVTSLTGPLAAELRFAIQQTAEISDLAGAVETCRQTPAPGYCRGPRRQPASTFVAADKAGAHARGADLAIVDELGLLPEGETGACRKRVLQLISAAGRAAFSVSRYAEIAQCLPSWQTGPSCCRLLSFHEHAAPAGCELTDRKAWNAGKPRTKERDQISLAYMEAAAARATVSPLPRKAAFGLST